MVCVLPFEAACTRSAQTRKGIPPHFLYTYGGIYTLVINIPPWVYMNQRCRVGICSLGGKAMTTTSATVDSHELRDLLAAATPTRVLDVRTPAEFETAHIAGSYNVPLDLLREHRDEIVAH